LSDIDRLKARMGWKLPWYSVRDSFDTDFGVDEWHGTNAFIRDGDHVFRTYLINNRGDEQMGSTWNYLDITALGRQETWEDSPEGYPQRAPYKWWNWHDNYDAETAPKVGRGVRRWRSRLPKARCRGESMTEAHPAHSTGGASRPRSTRFTRVGTVRTSQPMWMIRPSPAAAARVTKR
jgi:hypothetical protein